MALTAVTTCSDIGIVAMTAVFMLINLPCCGSRALLGEQMRAGCTGRARCGLSTGALPR